jgi:hypothetical protein
MWIQIFHHSLHQLLYYTTRVGLRLIEFKEADMGSMLLSSVFGRAVAQRLDAGFPPPRPGFAYGQQVGFVVDKAALGQVFSEYFGFPCQSFHRFFHYHNHPGLTQ